MNEKAWSWLCSLSLKILKQSQFNFPPWSRLNYANAILVKTKIK